MKKLLFLLAAICQVTIIIVSCGNQERKSSLEERTKSNIRQAYKKIALDKDFFSISDVEVFCSNDSICLVSFNVKDKDYDGNVFEKTLCYGRMILNNSRKRQPETDSREVDFMTDNKVDFLKAWAKQGYMEFYEVSLIYSQWKDSHPEFYHGNSSKKVIKHKEQDFNWYECIVDGMHGIVNVHGETVIKTMYDSIYYTYPSNKFDEEFVMFFTYKDEDGKANKGIAVADKNYKYLVSPLLFCGNANKIICSKAPLIYYYWVAYTPLSHDFGVGAIDSKGDIILWPVYRLVSYWSTLLDYGWKGEHLIDNFHFTLNSDDPFDLISSFYTINPKDNTAYFASNVLNNDLFLGYYLWEKTEFENGRIKYNDHGELGDKYKEIIISDNKLYIPYSRRKSPYVLDKYESDSYTKVFKVKDNPEFWDAEQYVFDDDGNMQIYFKRGRIETYRWVGKNLYDNKMNEISKAEEKYELEIQKLAEINWGIELFSDKGHEMIGTISSNQDRSSSSEDNSESELQTADDGLLYSGMYTVSGQGRDNATGQMTSDIGDMTYEVKIYEDCITFDGMSYKFHKMSGSTRVYEGMGMSFGYGSSQDYYYVDSNFNMKKVSEMSSGYGTSFVTYPISKGETTMPKYSNSGSGNGNYSSGSNTGNNNRHQRQESTRHQCTLCNGTGKIVRESSTATYGNDTKVYCSVCGRSYFRSTGHGHVTCPTCHGKGWY